MHMAKCSEFGFVYNLQISGGYSLSSLLGSIKSALDLFLIGGLSMNSGH